jgi:hypothetical protein
MTSFNLLSRRSQIKDVDCAQNDTANKNQDIYIYVHSQFSILMFPAFKVQISVLSALFTRYPNFKLITVAGHILNK